LNNLNTYDERDLDVVRNLSKLKEYRRIYMLDDDKRSDVDKYLASLPIRHTNAGVNQYIEYNVIVYEKTLSDFIKLAL
jgi:hypothetical protein